MTRIALGIEYNGAAYNGWQRQSHRPSIQEELEKALSKVADCPIEVFCAGRTDSGVHATGQVVHFDYNSDKPRDISAWLLGVNSLLPNDVSVKWAKEVDADFHARFSAKARRYKYYIYSYPVKRALYNNRALWVNKNLDIEAMNSACKYLLGEQDFSSLRSSQCESKSPNRNVISASVYSVNNEVMDSEIIIFDVKANAFLHHMVRNIVGCLLEIGLQHKSPKWLKDVILLKDRTKAARTAPPDGLYLVDVVY